MGDLRGEYRFLAPQLVAAGWRVVTLDLRSHGETSVPWPDYSVEAIGADIVAMLRALDAGPAVVVGTSMAAGAAVCAAAAAPEAVAGLVLIGPFVRDTMPRWQRAAMFSLLFSRPWGVAAWSSYYASLFPTAKPADFAAYTASQGSNLRQPGRLEALQAMMLASKQASEVALAKVKTPTLVIMGTRDPDFKDAAGEARSVAGRLHGDVRMVEGAGHYPHVEMPEQTGQEIVAFIRKTWASALQAA
jgi:pimeloyl-ACP methyl ester carboxylesterase